MQIVKGKIKHDCTYTQSLSLHANCKREQNAQIARRTLLDDEVGVWRVAAWLGLLGLTSSLHRLHSSTHSPPHSGFIIALNTDSHY